MKTSNTFFLVMIWALFSSGITVGQQVAKKTVVEHFTNTRCSICAGSNPGFYSQLAKNPNVLHVAYHPSSPYSSCLFSTQNKSENDARTNFYNLFGGTPVFSVNGDTKFTSELTPNNAYNNYNSQMSSLDVTTTLSSLVGSGTVTVNVDIKTVATTTFNQATLYIPLIEDTVFYNAPNGEKIHHDVFRKSFTGINPIQISPSKVIGESIQVVYTISLNPAWNVKRLYALAIVQDENKKLIQVDDSDLLTESQVSATDESTEMDDNFVIYPNPSKDVVTVLDPDHQIGQSAVFIDINGKVAKSIQWEGVEKKAAITDLPQGMYLLNSTLKSGKVFSKKVIKL